MSLVRRGSRSVSAEFVWHSEITDSNSRWWRMPQQSWQELKSSEDRFAIAGLIQLILERTGLRRIAVDRILGPPQVGQPAETDRNGPAIRPAVDLRWRFRRASKSSISEEIDEDWRQHNQTRMSFD